MEQIETGPCTDYIKEQFSELISELTVKKSSVVITTLPQYSKALLERCKVDEKLQFDMLVDMTAVDWMDARPQRYEVVYQLLSLKNKMRVTVSVAVGEEDPSIESVVSLWQGANFMEREVWDMFGISFHGHPDLRRVLLYDEFVGHPLRKDYPIQGKQPRVPLRYPEVENTARQMHRPELVTIRPRKASGDEQAQVSERIPTAEGI